eukprot:5016134-Prymnesium_polylepis.1
MAAAHGRCARTRGATAAALALESRSAHRSSQPVLAHPWKGPHARVVPLERRRHVRRLPPRDKLGPVPVQLVVLHPPSRAPHRGRHLGPIESVGVAVASQHCERTASRGR